MVQTTCEEKRITTEFFQLCITTNHGITGYVLNRSDEEIFADSKSELRRKIRLLVEELKFLEEKINE